MTGVHHVVGTGYWMLARVMFCLTRKRDEHCRVCLHTAWTVDPAVTSMILSEGVVGFGGPLQAMFLELTSV